jgi:hypothetical protein
MRAAVILVGIAVVAAIVYCTYCYRVELGLVKPQPHPGPAAEALSTEAQPGPDARAFAWQIVDRPGDGFKVDMPVGATETRVPAFTGNGSVDPVKTMEASMGPETFAVSWADNPPVERAGSEIALRTLDLARDGALARTGTTLTRESSSRQTGSMVRDFDARNDAGGILSARFVLTGTRLYMLTVTSSETDAHLSDAVSRFFNSFSVIAPSHGN